jgi:hypothetical protein
VADPTTIEWLLDGDAAVRWQVMRDLLDERDDVVAAERARVATSGCGARLLAHQDPEGTWADALYSPKWTSTTYTLLLLRQLGLPGDDPRARTACEVLIDRARYLDGGVTFAKTVAQPETCITAMLVNLAAAFGTVDSRVEHALAWLLDQQLADGGWNCETVRCGSRHGSFHTTIQTLEALHAWTLGSGGGGAVGEAADRGREFFANHRLYRSHRTGDSSTRASSAWCSRQDGITTCCADWTTSRRPPRRPTRDWETRSPCCGPSAGLTARGSTTPRTPAATGSN